MESLEDCTLSGIIKCNTSFTIKSTASLLRDEFGTFPGFFADIHFTAII